MSQSTNSVKVTDQFLFVDSDVLHDDRNVSTIFDDLDREFGLSGFIEEIDALFCFLR